MYNSYLHIFSLQDSGLTKLSDMNGKVVATGTPGGSSQIVGDAIIDILGYTPASTSPISLSQVMDNLKDGQCDIGMAVSNYPVSSLVELQATHPFQLIQMTDDELAKLKATNAGYGDGLVPAGTYEGQTADYNTLSFFTLCLVTSDMDEDTAYRLTKYVFESLPELGEAVGNVKEVIAESILASPIPIHPGAAKYYKEVGVAIPDDMIK
jgi:TRAP transporter TAXI family solute receptor